MQLSVIIVNYNVKYFLEQCLYSLRKATDGIAVEIIVVDNSSTDGSIAYLQPHFPEVQFIINDNNCGFAKACNEGLTSASGEYILFLNPDTIVSEEALKKCICFFAKHPDAGAVGVRMIDGGGNFLKESKRSFPSPLTSLFKLSGFARAFPQSKTFGKYHLGHLDDYQNHEVDVLAGAFMMVKKKVLEETGSFDETFFMYGEDIDLSYRIQKKGYKNYYVAETEIIHFKGESTKRGSLNYVRLFYNAMSLFVKKHYAGTKAKLFILSIHFAIWIRAAIAALAKLIKWMPVLDAALILISFWLIKSFWAAFIKPDIVYPDKLLLIAFPAFTFVYLTVAYYAGLYDKRYRNKNLVRSTFIATVVLLALYALLPEKFRFSRGMIVFGALLAFVMINLMRRVLLYAGALQPPEEQITKPYILIAGTQTEYEEVRHLLALRGLDNKIIGRIAVDEDNQHTVGAIRNISEIAMISDAQEIIFCAGILSYQTIIALIQNINIAVRLRFHAAGSDSIVSSDSGHAAGETITADTLFNIAHADNSRIKRLIDIAFSFLSLLFFPLPFLLMKHPLLFFKNCFQIIAGKKTWVGYITDNKTLPPIRSGIIGANGIIKNGASSLPLENLQTIDYWYAKDYQPWDDIKIIISNYKYLGGEWSIVNGE